MFVSSPQVKLGDNIRNIPTPALILDFESFSANLKKLPETLKQINSKVHFRPHAKAHKCPIIAQLQILSGAVGVCVQKLSEAEAMVAGGIKDVLISNEVVERSKLFRVATLSKYATISLCVDNLQVIRELGEIARYVNVQIDVLVEVNVGHDRCGVDPKDVVQYAKAVNEWNPHLTFKGIQCYHGRNQHIRKYVERKAAVEKSAECARRAFTLLRDAGIECPVVTGGGTGTYLFEAASGIYTEVQPGSYIFMDIDYSLNLDQNDEPISDFKQSLFILTTVMSDTNHDKGWVVVDAGLKASSVDSGLPRIDSYSQLEYLNAGDEHGKIRVKEGINSTLPSNLKVGSKLKLIPGHCDPTVNMYNHLIVVRNDQVEAIWPITAREPQFSALFLFCIL